MCAQARRAPAPRAAARASPSKPVVRTRTSRARASGRSGREALAAALVSAEAEQVGRRARACWCARRRRRSPPWPSMQPTSASAVKSNSVSSRDAGRIPPSGPPIWSALSSWPSTMPPATSSHSSRTVMPKRTSYTPGRRNRSLKQTSLVPGVASGLRSRYAVAPLAATNGMFASVSVLLTTVGIPYRPRHGRERRAGGHRRPASLDAGEQRRLLADDVRAGALEDGDVEAEAAALNVLAEPAGLPGGRRGGVENRLGVRILRPGEHEAVVRANRVGGERHAFEYARRRSLHQVFIDVRAGVALIAVGDDELVLARGVARELPLRARRESGAAPTADSGLLDLLQQFLRSEFGERALQAGPVTLAQQNRLIEDAVPVRLGCAPRRAAPHAADHVCARIDHVAVTDRGRGVAEAQADRLGE